ncbi:glycosyltransferase [Caulobacter sp. Root655]|uniref:glycosyltransferase n=1 Tax=Caulobacter sp. Root655 TaxID=1736578 RepID=UPI000ABDD5C0|nr:glycosyltransferase [Caulobacter sp. Root655]
MIDHRDVSRVRAGINLTRLQSGGKGAGGAGLFALEFARVASELFDVDIFVRPENEAIVRKFLGKDSRGQVVKLERPELALTNASSALDLYVDPLNGLEPYEISTFAVPVIHDMLFLEEPQFFDQCELDFRREHYGSAIDRADLVLTVSSNEVDKIKRHFGKKAVDWIPQPPYFSLLDQEASPTVAERRNLIFPAVQWNHKNHYRLFQAFIHLIETEQLPDDVDLLFSRVFPIEANTRLHHQLLTDARLGQRIRPIPYLSTPDFAGLLNNSLGMVYPSLYEGWGVPVTESALNGLPLLTSNSPSAEALNPPPANIRQFKNVLDAQQIANDLREFVLNPPPRLQPRPRETFVAPFREKIREIGHRAVSSRRIRTPIGVKPAWPKVVQRKPGLKIVLVCETAPTQEQLATLRELVGADDGQVEAVVLMPFGQTEADFSGLARACHNGSTKSLDTALVYELVMSRRAQVLVLAPDALADLKVKVLAGSVRLLAEGKSINAIRVAPALPPRIAGDVAMMLMGRMVSVAAFVDGFGATPTLLAETMRQRLVEPAVCAGPKLIICDPALSNKVGHHAAVADWMARGAHANGLTPLVFGNHACPRGLLAPEVDTYGAFSDFLYGNVADIGLFTHEFRLMAEFAAAGPDDVITLFCATPAMLAGALPFLLERKPDQRPRIVIRFDRSEERTPKARLSYAQAFARLNGLGLRSSFSFFVESKGLQDYFEDICGEVFPLLFNPLPSAGQAGSKQDGRLCLGYLGEARVEKGFQVLPFIVEYLLAQDDLRDKVRFFIQTGANPVNEQPLVISARQQLERRALNDDRLVLKGFLSEDEYASAIADIDILMLPYGPGDYTRRGSGVATEAVSAGKPLVVSRGLDIAGTYAGAGIVEPRVQNELGLAQACAEAARRFKELEAQSLDYRARNARLFGDEASFVAQIVAKLDSTVPPRGRLVLWISNDTRGEGSGVVYDSQLSYLDEAGFTSIKLVIPYPNIHRVTGADFDHGEFLDTLQWTPSFADTPRFQATLDAFAQDGNSYLNFQRAWRELEFPEELKRILLHADLEFAVVNYAHHSAVLETLNLSDLPMICEAHDIQAYQYAIQQQRPADPIEVAHEFEALKDFAHVVSISKREADEISATLDPKKVSWRMPFIAEPRVSIVVPEIGVDDADAEPAPPLEVTDLLLVGSLHDANVASAAWFINTVYKPMLYDQGVTLRIVGKVCSALDTGFLADQIDYVGWVGDLREYYLATRVVTLPIVTGAGVPIKVLDAFSQGLPFSMMDFPAPAMDLPKDFPVSRNGIEMAEDIIALLKNPAKAAIRARKGLDFYRNIASRRRYLEAWDGILTSIGVPAKTTPGPLI